MSLQPSDRTGGGGEGLYTALLVISALALLLGFALVQMTLYSNYGILWLFKVGG